MSKHTTKTTNNYKRQMAASTVTPTKLDKKTQEFKEIFKKEFGIDLTDQQAQEKATAVLNAMRVILKPTQ